MYSIIGHGACRALQEWPIRHVKPTVHVVAAALPILEHPPTTPDTSTQHWLVQAFLFAHRLGTIRENEYEFFKEDGNYSAETTGPTASASVIGRRRRMETKDESSRPAAATTAENKALSQQSALL